MKRFRYTFFIIILLTTKSVIAQKSRSESKLANSYGLNDSLLKIWRQDKFGCKQKRISLIDSLFKKDILIGMPKREFMILFGNPDKISSDGTFIYKNVGNCDSNNKPVKETISLDVGVYFKNEKVNLFGTIYVD